MKKEYESEPEVESEPPKKMADLGPRKFEGIGPVTKEGIPLVLRSVSPLTIAITSARCSFATYVFLLTRFTFYALKSARNSPLSNNSLDTLPDKLLSGSQGEQSGEMVQENVRLVASRRSRR